MALLEYYLKKISLFAVKCQKVLAMCAKAVYNKHALLLNAHLCKILRSDRKMSNSVFQSVIVQLRDVSDRTFGVIDTEGSVVSCTVMLFESRQCPRPCSILH